MCSIGNPPVHLERGPEIEDVGGFVAVDVGGPPQRSSPFDPGETGRRMTRGHQAALKNRIALLLSWGKGKGSEGHRKGKWMGMGKVKGSEVVELNSQIKLCITCHRRRE